MESSSEVLLKSIRSFFENEKALESLTTYLVEPETKISLRMLDWLVTNYAKKYNVAYLFPDSDGGQRIFNMYLEYKSQLKSFSKSMFDPFKRGARLDFKDSKGREFESTVGQLNFFKWALRHNVIEYAIEHAAGIERDMADSTKKRHADPSPGDTPVVTQGKRSHLTRMRPCTTTTIRVRVTFR